MIPEKRKKNTHKKSIENFNIEYQKQIKKKLKNSLISKIKENNFDLNNKEHIDSLIKNIRNDFNQVYEDERLNQRKNDDKKWSFVSQYDRIEFRIMGNDYLKEDTMKYIIEMQGIYYQQVVEPEEIKKQCEYRFIKRILKEIKNENDKNTNTNKSDDEKKIKKFITDQNKLLDELMTKIEKDTLIIKDEKIEFGSEELKMVTWNVKRMIVGGYNKLFNKNVSINFDKSDYESKEKLLSKLNKIKQLLIKMDQLRLKNELNSKWKDTEKYDEYKEKIKKNKQDNDVEKILDV